jgi:tripartite-type tricarboxylate transporter receptor subunit TctC
MKHPQYGSWAIACALLVALMSLGSFAAYAQQPFPSRTIRIVSSQAGGSNDFGSRLVAEELSQALGQAAVVENRAGGVIAGSVVAKSPPDGHTLLHYGTTLWLLPLLRDDVPYDPIRDFIPIIGSINSITVLVVHPSLPVKSAKELIALARSRPGQIDYSSATAGTANHLAAELFAAKAGIKFRRIPFKGAASALNSVATGEVQVNFPTYASILPFLNAGKVRLLGVTTAKATDVVPGAIPLSEVVPGYESNARAGFFAPAGTPPAIIGRLHKEILAALSKPLNRERLKKIGTEVNSIPGQEFTAMMQREMQEYGKLFKQLGVRDE